MDAVDDGAVVNELLEDAEVSSVEDEYSGSCDSEEGNENWYYMPDSILLSIFQLLSPKEVTTAGMVCKSWNRVSHDELLWKELFYRTYKIDPSVGIMPGILLITILLLINNFIHLFCY